MPTNQPLSAARATLALAVAVLACSPALAAAQQWEQQSPLPAPPQVQPRIAFLDAQRGYMAGLEPVPLETLDGGLTWHPAPIPGQRYRLVFALDAQHAWAMGVDQNARTVDGGQTWQSLPFLGLDETVEFLTPSFGWASGNWAGAVTHDGGLTWKVAIVDAGTRVRYPHFRDAQVGVGVEDDSSAIWRTTDGGQTWQEVHAATAFRVRFLSPTTVIALGGNQIHRSTDAGLSWQTVHAGAAAARLVELDAQRLFTWQGTSTTRSSDGGATWTSGSFGVSFAVHDVVHTGGQELLAVDDRGDVLRSTDAGATWTMVRQGTHVQLNDLALLPGGRLVAVGPGYVVASDDGGATWTQTSSGTGQHVHDIAMWDGSRGLFGGAQAAVGLTGDGGGHWSHSAPAWQFLGMNDIEAVDVVAPDFGIVVGEAGPPLVTHDAGQTWSPLPAFTASYALQSVDFLTDQLGWVGSVGPTAYILRTTDGGATWQLQYGPTFGGIRGLHMVDASIGYALNGGAILLRTTDGGQTWNESQLPVSGGSLHVAFSDASRGWIVGEFGLILRTTDGGATWQQQGSGTQKHLQHVAVVGATEAYVAGWNNSLLHTTDDGQTWTPIAVPAGDPQQGWTSVHVGDGGALWLAGFYGAVMHRPGSGSSWQSYCTAKATSLGCTPAVSATGTPGPSTGAPFVVGASPIPSGQHGVLFYGVHGPAAAPFQGGTLCVSPPTVRTPLQAAGGNAPPSSDCSGGFAFDFDAWIAAGHDPALAQGVTVHAQYWFRDPGDPFGTGLSDGIEFLIQP